MSRPHDSIIFLTEAAKYFEKRPTNGEDKAYWANVYNAENCHKVIDEINYLKTTIDSMLIDIEKWDTVLIEDEVTHHSYIGKDIADDLRKKYGIK
jgi:hypothetical protein